MDINHDNAESPYFDIVKEQLYKLGDDVLLEDIDLICKYIVLRFFKLSPKMHSASNIADAQLELAKFVRGIYPFLVTFITVANSPALQIKSEA